ncbi:hypothetical protein U1Q18_033965 [Sarracenia purpurea var. burkii]
MSHRGTDKKSNDNSEVMPSSLSTERDSSFPVSIDRNSSFSMSDGSFVVILPENEAEGTTWDIGEEVEETRYVSPEEARVVVELRSSLANNHKGLARKVLPDMVGLLNSRFWSLECLVEEISLFLEDSSKFLARKNLYVGVGLFIFVILT